MIVQDNLKIMIFTLMKRKTEEMWHYKIISDLLIKNNIWDGRGSKAPHRIVYTTMHESVKKREGYFVLVGGGLFMVENEVFVKNYEHFEELVNSIRDNRKTPDKRRFKKASETEEDRNNRIKYLDSPPVCGNCKYFKYNNFQKLDKEYGECMNKEVDRNTVANMANPCELHFRQSHNKFLLLRRSIYEEMAKENNVRK